MHVSAESQLPQAVLVRVMQLLPLSTRLRNCALVSKAWAAAAAAATVEVEASLSHHPASLQSWLQQHGGRITSLVLTGLAYGDHLAGQQLLLTCVDFQHLTRLELQQVPLQLERPAGPPQSHISSYPDEHTEEYQGPAVLSANSMPGLNAMGLQECFFISLDSFLQLLQPPSLRKLKLCSVQLLGDLSTEQLAQALLAHPPQLPGLTKLVVQQCNWAHVLLQHCSSFTQLQELQLEDQGVSASCFQHIPSCLTALSVKGSLQTPLDLLQHPSMPPQMPQLGNLRALQLWHVSLIPNLLCCFPELQELEVRGCNLLPSDPAASGAALLQAIGQLQQLQSLILIENEVQMGLEQRQPELFAALTASSHLTQLRVQWEHQQLLVPGSAQHMFSPDKHLRYLQVLHVSSFRNSETHGPAWLDAGGIYSIASCCSGLCDLTLISCVQPDSDVSGLLKLPACRKLAVGGAAFGDEQAAVIAQLSALTGLCWVNSPGLSDAGLLQLTALKGLNGLSVLECGGITCREATDSSCHGIELSDQENSLPVWQQLARMCTDTPDTQPFNLMQSLQLEQSSCSKQQQQQQQEQEQEQQQQEEPPPPPQQQEEEEEEEELPAEFKPQYEALQDEHTRLLQERIELQQGVSTVRADIDATLQAIAVQEQQAAELEQQNAELQSQMAAGSAQLQSGPLWQLIADVAQAMAGSDGSGGGGGGGIQTQPQPESAMQRLTDLLLPGLQAANQQQCRSDQP